eukprot:gene11244-13124_t
MNMKKLLSNNAWSPMHFKFTKQKRLSEKSHKQYLSICRHNVLICISLSLFCFSLKAQNVPVEITNIVPPSSEVSKLGTFGGFTKKLSTGQVDVNVPIHIVEGNSLKYPINIIYDPAGIQVKSRATSVGLNWTFGGVGVITKTVIGSPDEEPTYGYNSSYVYGGQFRGVVYTPTDLINDPVLQTALGGKDMEPDIFSFSFNGRGGKFYYNPETNQYYTMPYSKLAISRSTMGPGGAFQITDEKGYVYVFDKPVDTHNDFGTSPFNNDKSVTYTSQWYLSKVYAPDGNQEFSFEYLEDHLVAEQLGTSQTYTYLYSGSGSCVTGNTSTIMPLIGGTTGYSNDESMQLDSISFSKNGVQNQYWKLFHSYYQNANKLKLDSIGQYAGGKRESSYKFEYDTSPIPAIDKQYIGNASREPVFNNAKAGILTKVIYPTGGSSEFTYELNDYGSSTRPGNEEKEPIIQNIQKSLNRRYSTDGAGTSTLTFTLEKSEVMTFTSYRDNCNNGSSPCSNDPNTTEIKLTTFNGSWSLNGPNKKSTTTVLELLPGTYTVNITVGEILEYGRVSFSLPSITGYNYKIAAGGLRIKKLINYDPVTNQSNIKKYEYTVKGAVDRSSGTILSKPNYVYTTQNGQACNSGTGTTLPNCMGWQTLVTVTSQSNNELFFSEGSPVAYTRVIEYIGENGEGGSVEHLFSFSQDEITRGFPFPVPSSRSWRRGLPQKTTYLTAAGDTTHKEINEYYFEPTLNRNQVIGYKTGLYKYCPAMASAIEINIGQMDYTSEWFYLKKNVKTIYGSSGLAQTSDVTEYFYDNPQHIQTTRTKHTLSNDKFNVTHFKYPLDYTISSNTTDAASKALYKMQTKNMIEYPVEQTECVDNAGQETIRKSDLFLYNEFADNHIYSSKQYEFVSETPAAYSPLTTSQNGVLNFNSNYQFRVEASKYNPQGKRMEFINNAGLKKSVIYHSNGLLPIAFINNAAANQVYYNGFEESTLPTMSTISKYGKKSNNGIYVVPGSAVISGVYTKCWWEQVGGVWVYNAIPFTHNGSDNIVFGTGNLIDNLAVYPQEAELTSYDYDLSEGLLNKVNANGNGIQFKYDSMLRLKAITDQGGNIIKAYDYHYKP